MNYYYRTIARDHLGKLELIKRKDVPREALKILRTKDWSISPDDYIYIRAFISNNAKFSTKEKIFYATLQACKVIVYDIWNF